MGGTNTGSAISFLRKTMFTVANGDRPGVPDVAIVVTDGKSNDPVSTLTEAQLAHDANITLVALGIGGGVDSNELNNIASDPDSENVYEVADFDSLSTIVDSLTSSTCGVAGPVTAGGGNGTSGSGPGPAVTTVAVSTTPAPACRSNQRADIVFVLDSSGSIGGDNFVKVKQFIADVVSKFDVGGATVRIGLVTYTYKARLQFHLNAYTNLADILTAIQNVPYITGSTNTASGIAYMRDVMFTAPNGERTGVPNIAIVITDGKSLSMDWTLGDAQAAKDAGITLLALGVSKSVFMDEINGIASDPDSDHAFSVLKFDDLGTLVQDVADSACEAIPEGITGRRKRRPFWSFSKETTTTKPSPVTVPVPMSGTPVCVTSQKADIVFMMDSSGSIQLINFVKLKQFVHDVIDHFDIGPSGINVGVMTFGFYPILQFNLDAFTSKTDIQDAIMKTWYIPGFTNTAAAITYMRQTMFTASNGDRSSAPNIAVIISDGKSSDKSKTVAEAALAKADNITMIAIGVGSDVDKQELDDVASDPDSNHSFDVASFDGLAALNMLIAQTTCNVAAPPTSTCSTTERADIVFVMDSSGSIGRSNFKTMTQFVHDVVGTFNIGVSNVNVGLMKYGFQPALEFNLNKYTTKADTLAAILNIKYKSGFTNTGGAIAYMRTSMFTNANGDRPGVKNIAVVISDGNSRDSASTVLEAALARDANITMIAIGIGSKVDQQELNDIASDPDRKYAFDISTFDALGTFKDTLAETTCIAAAVPTTVAPPTTTPTTTPTTIPTTTSTTTPSTTSTTPSTTPGTTPTSTTPTTTTPIPTIEACIGNVADVVFAVDASGSIGQINFQKVRKFLNNIISVFDIASNTTRVGLLRYSDIPVLEFHMNSHLNRPDVLTAVSNIGYYGGGTRTSDAIKFIVDQSFTASNGDRPGVPNIAIIITDGKSNDQLATRLEADRARANGITLFAVGISNATNPGEISDIADDPDAKFVFTVEDFDALSSIQYQLAEVSCQVTGRPVVTTSAAPCTDLIAECGLFDAEVCKLNLFDAQTQCPLTCGMCTPTGKREAVDRATAKPIRWQDGCPIWPLRPECSLTKPSDGSCPFPLCS
ncbi:collagen alpha-3(VI) chain-like [Lineus longissimus]|uniref:collagen alpha-3(VI) chain-like n=1 Tax=Lineus longissimus TaxID=88925 RepID=UPI00315CD014